MCPTAGVELLLLLILVNRAAHTSALKCLDFAPTACAGVELLLLILKGKRAARTSALKCLDFATTRCPPACDRTVDQQGLKTLFAIFMGKLKVQFEERLRRGIRGGSSCYQNLLNCDFRSSRAGSSCVLVAVLIDNGALWGRRM